MDDMEAMERLEQQLIQRSEEVRLYRFPGLQQ